jgi:hypothetical protein
LEKNNENIYADRFGNWEYATTPFVSWAMMDNRIDVNLGRDCREVPTFLEEGISPDRSMASQYHEVKSKS